MNYAHRNIITLKWQQIREWEAERYVASFVVSKKKRKIKTAVLSKINHCASPKTSVTSLSLCVWSRAVRDTMWNPASESGTWGINTDWWLGIINHNALSKIILRGKKNDDSKRKLYGSALGSCSILSTGSRSWWRRKPIMSKTCLMRLTILN